MTTPLRMRVIEAMERTMGHCEPYAEDALDAILDCLTENADELARRWAVMTFEADRDIPDGTRGKSVDLAKVGLADLLAVLREDR